MAGPEEQAPTVMQLLRVASKYLGERGIESPRLDAEVLLAHALGMDRMGLYVQFDRLLESREVDAYRGLIADRARHRPVAQLTGAKEFFGLVFRVTPDVLVPRPETELLVEGALDRIDERRSATVLDVGTGSGAIAVSIAVHRPSARVWAVDVSEAALAVARENAEANGVSGRIRFGLSDWLDGVVTGPSDEPRFDVVLSNPPYIPSAAIDFLPADVRRFEPRLALDGGPDGLDSYRVLLRETGRCIAPGGWLGVEIGDGQEGALTELAAGAGGWERPIFERDLQRIARVCWLRKEGAERRAGESSAQLNGRGEEAAPPNRRGVREGGGREGARWQDAAWRDAPWHPAYRRALPLADRVDCGTVVFDIDPERPDPKKVRIAAQVLAHGGLVAFPTETVYGLGADAGSPEAVRRLYEAKGRPADNPLIVHAASSEQVQSLCSGCNESLLDLMKRLADAFWPGPLTVILPNAGTVAGEVTGGRDSVAFRVPASPVARALIAASNRPIAAPSANRSGRPSPTRAEHVLEDLAGVVPIVIDCGPTAFGIESTVCDITVTPPAVLRPGSVTAAELEAVCGGPVRVEGGDVGDAAGAVPADASSEGVPGAEAGTAADGQPPRAPGMKYRHYAPRQPMLVLEGTVGTIIDRLADEVARAARAGERLGFLLTRETAESFERARRGGTVPGTSAPPVVVVLGRRSNPDEVSAALFSGLRDAESAGVDRIIAEGIEECGVGAAVMNRLRKAAGGNVEQLPRD